MTFGVKLVENGSNLLTDHWTAQGSAFVVCGLMSAITLVTVIATDRNVKTMKISPKVSHTGIILGWFDSL